MLQHQALHRPPSRPNERHPCPAASSVNTSTRERSQWPRFLAGLSGSPRRCRATAERIHQCPSSKQPFSSRRSQSNSTKRGRDFRTSQLPFGQAYASTQTSYSVFILTPLEGSTSLPPLRYRWKSVFVCWSALAGLNFRPPGAVV